MTLADLKAKAAQAAGKEPEAAEPETGEKTTEIVETQDRATLDGLLGWIKRYSDYWAPLLPQHHSPEAFELAAMNAILNSESLARGVRANPTSFVHAMSMCAHFGLMPDGIQAALAAQDGAVEFIPMYRGYIALMHRTGVIRSVHFDHICEGDQVTLNKGALPPDDFKHEIDVFQIDKKDREPRVAYAFAWMLNGFRTEVVLMGRDRAEAIRDEYSRSYQEAEKARRDSPEEFAEFPELEKFHSFWHDHFDAMWLKSVVILLAKRLDLSPELRELLAADSADSPSGQKAVTPVKVMRALTKSAPPQKKPSREDEEKSPGKKLAPAKA